MKSLLRSCPLFAVAFEALGTLFTVACGNDDRDPGSSEGALNYYGDDS